MVVTSIEKQQRGKRYNVLCDGEFSFAVSEETLLKFGLRTGDELSEEKKEIIQAEEEFRFAYISALRSLSRGRKTEFEIRQKLKRKKIASVFVEKVIRLLLKNRLLDDVSYSHDYVAERLRRKPTGKRMLHQQLMKKGIAKRLIEDSTKEISEETELENAFALTKKKMLRTQSFSKKDQQDVSKKLGQYLYRRGFSSDIVFKVLRKIFQNSDELFEEKIFAPKSSGHIQFSNAE